MRHSIQYSFIALGLLLASGCSGNTGEKDEAKPLLQNVVAKGSLKNCKNPKLVCTQSYPEVCYEYCDDDAPCQTVESCAMSYPVQCFEECIEPKVPEEECAGPETVVSSDGETFPVCTDEGIAGPPGTGGGSSPGNPGPGGEDGSPPNPPGGEDGSPPNPPGSEDGSPPNLPGGEDGSPPSN